MKDVKMHICPTCGGKLNVNTERQMYECPFCGVTFDYDYFREESVLGLAAQSLMNKEFASADRAYDFMLEKEPDNFEALRGKALIAMNIPKIDDIRSLDTLSKIDYEPVCKEIDRAIGSSKYQEREYFTVMKDIVDSGREYFDEKAQLKIQGTERDKTLNRLHELSEEKDNIYVRSANKIRPKKAVILTFVCYILSCLFIFLYFMSVTRNPYSKAEDLSKYQTEQTEASNQYVMDYTIDSDDLDAIANYMQYQEALEREEQRKINYDTWEANHHFSIFHLICPLCVATVVFAVIIFMLFMWGRHLNAEIAKVKVIADEQADKIKDREKRMDEIKDGIEQGYKRLCELHPVNG